MIFMDMNFDEYEKEYLKKLGINEESEDGTLVPLDFIILRLLKSDTQTYWGLVKKLDKVDVKKLNKHLERLYKLEYLDNEKNDGWLRKNISPNLKLTEKALVVLKQKRKELKKEWEEIELLYKDKDSDKLEQKLMTKKDLLPLFLMMGFTNGLMMGQMMALSDLNYQALMQGMDYAYVGGYTEGFADGGGFDDGGGDGGGFMDGGFQPNF